MLVVVEEEEEKKHDVVPSAVVECRPMDLDTSSSSDSWAAHDNIAAAHEEQEQSILLAWA